MNRKNIQGRIVMVSGGSGGIGSALSGALVESGAVVIASARHDPSGIPPQGGFFIETDLRSPQSWSRLVGTVMERYGRIDALVNCMGALIPGPFDGLSDEDIRTVVETNVLGTLFGVKAVIPVMKAQGSGHIINLGSLGGILPMPYGALYSSTKFAVRGFTLSLGEELKRSGIKVTLISPGPVRTPMLDRESLDDRSTIAFVTRPLSPRDVAEAVLGVLASPRSEVLIPGVSGRLALVGGRFPKLLPAAFPFLDIIGGMRMRIYRRRHALRASTGK
jgi:NAD(P)-dependent dehydrogenase (short-subunit alcohol dehydrogenase family)